MKLVLASYNVAFILGLIIFMKGYFLLRPESEVRSNNLTESYRASDSGSYQPDRLFLFIVDGMRLDYMKRFPSSKSSKIEFGDDDTKTVEGMVKGFDGSNVNNNRASTIHNRLSILSKLAKEEPRSTLFYGVISDPPTVTSTRLKALTTGGIPSFMELFSNLDCNRLLEDNWVEQMIDVDRKGCSNERGRFILAGDDTWAKLFPQIFNGSESCPLSSFDTHDLYSVDDTIESFFGFNSDVKGNFGDNNSKAGFARDKIDEYNSKSCPDKLGNFNISSESWRLIIAHFLGVDHVGHSYDAFHAKMAERLDRMNSLIEETVRMLPDNSLLMIMGDHGMSDDGDHGGSSKEETETGVFIYLKREGRDLNDCSMSDSCNDNDSDNYKLMPYWNNSNHAFEFRHYEDILENPRMIYQIDLVATISSIFDLPIPFSNVGGLIPDLFLLVNRANICNNGLLCSDSDGLYSSGPFTRLSLAHLLVALQVNVMQIYRYYESYFGIDNDDRLISLRGLIPDFNCDGGTQSNESLTMKLNNNRTINSNRYYESCKNQSEVELIIKNSLSFLQASVVLARDLWLTYDVPYMITGLVIMLVAAVSIIYSYYENIPSFNLSPSSYLIKLLLLITITTTFLHTIGPFSDNLINFEGVIHRISIIAVTILICLMHLTSRYRDRNLSFTSDKTAKSNQRDTFSWFSKFSNSLFFYFIDILLTISLALQVYLCLLWKQNPSVNSDYIGLYLRYLLIFQASLIFTFHPEIGLKVIGTLTNCIKDSCSCSTLRSDKTEVVPSPLHALYWMLNAIAGRLTQFLSYLIFVIILVRFFHFNFSFSKSDYLITTFIDFAMSSDIVSYIISNKSVISIAILGIVTQLIIKTLGIITGLESDNTPHIVFILTLSIICANPTDGSTVMLSAVFIFAFICSILINAYENLTLDVLHLDSSHKDASSIIIIFHLYVIIFIRFCYFLSGHSMNINDVPIAVGPLVLGEYHPILAPFVVIFNCLSYELTLLLILKVFLQVRCGNLTKNNKMETFVHSSNTNLYTKNTNTNTNDIIRPKNHSLRLFETVLTFYSVYRLLILLMCSFSCFWLRRHLMILSIFTPKLIIEGVHYIFSLIVCLLLK